MHAFIHPTADFPPTFRFLLDWIAAGPQIFSLLHFVAVLEHKARREKKVRATEVEEGTEGEGGAS